MDYFYGEMLGVLVLRDVYTGGHSDRVPFVAFNKTCIPALLSIPESINQNSDSLKNLISA